MIKQVLNIFIIALLGNLGYAQNDLKINVLDKKYIVKDTCKKSSKKYFYIDGNKYIEYEHMPDYLYYTAVRHKDKYLMDSILNKLKLIKVSGNSINVHSSVSVLKKQNGKKFKKNNDKILKALREKGIQVGPVRYSDNSFFTNYLFIEIEKGKEKEIINDLRSRGIFYLEKRSRFYYFKVDDAVGYGIVKIANKLKKYQGIQSIRISIVGGPKLF